jgi:hypothetical protein
MDINEQIALQMAKERMREAVRAAEQRRAIGFERAGRPVRVRLGGVLVRLGHWMMGQA